MSIEQAAAGSSSHHLPAAQEPVAFQCMALFRRCLFQIGKSTEWILDAQRAICRQMRYGHLALLLFPSSSQILRRRIGGSGRLEDQEDQDVVKRPVLLSIRTLEWVHPSITGLSRFG